MAAKRCAATTVGIIGSAGRKGDAKKMTKDVFYAMMSKAEEVVRKHFKLDLSRVHLVSGGAAWADHIAVMEYIEEKVHGLTLHLPTTWQQDSSSPCFLDNQDSNIYRNPGRSANKLHKQFTAKIGEDSLQQIQSGVYLGAEYHVHDGFKERNTAVAKDSEYLIAFTWNNGKTPKEESGTYDTWKKHRGTKLHIPIGSLPGTTGRKSIPSFFTERKKPVSDTALEPVGSQSADSADSGCCCSSLSESLSCSGPSQASDCEQIQHSGREWQPWSGKGDSGTTVGKRKRGATIPGTTMNTKKPKLHHH